MSRIESNFAKNAFILVSLSFISLHSKANFTIFIVVKDKFPLGWMLRPEMLAIIVTHHCTSACAGCCFGCSPRVSSSLDEKVMADFIKTCTSLYPEIRVMVLTGGEVLSLDIEMVKRILRLAKSCGLTTRIVTNAFWATTISAASLLMDELVHAGLDEINVSTGDVHQRFVPLKNILNVVRCAERVDGLRTCLVVVEDAPKRVFSKDDMVASLKKMKMEINKTRVISSPWVDLESKSCLFQKNEIRKKSAAEDFFCAKERGCDDLFRSIQVNPRG